MSPSDVSWMFVTALGLIIGSYLNVVVYRLPRGVSTVYPGSRCPRCVMPVRPWDNVPVLGYLWLMGRCRDCGMGISLRYPLVEATIGIWFAFCHFHAANLLEQIVTSALGAALLVLALIDFDHLQVPTVIPAVGVVIGLVLQPWLLWTDLSQGLPALGPPRGEALLGIVGAWLAVTMLGAAGRLLGVENGLASGDAQVLAMLGAFFGWRGAVACFFVACVVALAIGGSNALLRRRSLSEPIPFVTFLCIAAVLVLMAGPLGAHP